MSRNLDEILGTKTCEADWRYVRPAPAPALEETPTTSMPTDPQTRHVTVGPGSQSVVIYYDAAAEHDLSLRKKIADLLKR